MSEKGGLSLVLRNVHNSNIVGVNVDCLVTDNELFVLLLLVSMFQHKEFGIYKIKLVFPQSRLQVKEAWASIHGTYELSLALFLDA